MGRCEICSNLLPEAFSDTASDRHAQIFVKIRDIKDSFCPECSVIWNALWQRKTVWTDAEYDRYIELVITTGRPLVLIWRDNSVVLELFSGWKDSNIIRSQPTDTPFGLATRVAEHSSAQECFQLAFSWLQTCIQNHTTCGRGSMSELPTRVIDVHAALGQTVKLVETRRKRIKYVALSYCWGAPSSHNVRTTSSSLQQHEVGISLGSLPQTLRDAVAISRRLGIGYLWVDALCIIQDDPNDWARESANMCNIYLNAELTISADSSGNTQQGIFNKQLYGTRCTEIPYKDGSVVYTRKALAREHLKYNYSMREKVPEPINCRGWTLQEALLSNRVLRYTLKELVWECNESIFCECANSPGSKAVDEFDDSHVRDPAALARLPINQIYQNWDNIVMRFTQRSLGQEKDKLPALSGLASQFAAAFQIASPTTPVRYLAGMWLSNLAQSLLWAVEDDVDRDAHDKDVIFCRPQTWRAPSWSWAAVDGPIWLFPYLDFSSQLVVLEAETILKTVDTFGQVASGKLVVKGRVLRDLPFQTFQRTPDQTHAGYTLGTRYTVRYKQRLRTFTPDSVDDFDTSSQSVTSMSLAALLIGTFDTKGAVVKHEEAFIIMRPKVSQSASFMGSKHQVFERVGVSIREYRENKQPASDKTGAQKDEDVFGTQGIQGFFDGLPEEVIILV